MGESSGKFLFPHCGRGRRLEDGLPAIRPNRGYGVPHGNQTCWARKRACTRGESLRVPGEIGGIINSGSGEAEGSYTSKTFPLAEGTAGIARSVGEEGLELALAAVAQAEEDSASARGGLLYHRQCAAASKDLPGKWWRNGVAPPDRTR